MASLQASLQAAAAAAGLQAVAPAAGLQAVALIIPLPSEFPKVHEALTNFQARHFANGTIFDSLYQVTFDSSWHDTNLSVVTFPANRLVEFAESLRAYGLSLVRGTPTFFNDTWHDSYTPGPMLRKLGMEVGYRIFVFEALPPDGKVIRVGTTLTELRLKK